MTSPTSGTYTPPPGRGRCPTGKVCFATRKQARQSRRKVSSSDPIGIYRCPACDWFHLGHKPQRVRNGEIDKSAWLRTKGQA